jgi:UDP-glucose 4-epimerase
MVEPIVAVIVPALNEARKIGRVLDKMPDDPRFEVIVVDDQSDDGTGDEARAHGAALVIRHEVRQGVGIGERRALRDTDIMSGNVKLALSHVVPDLALKVMKGQDPLHILGDGSQIRHYTYGGDLAHGIRLAMESDKAVNDDFNLSTAASTTVLELAQAIWHKIHGAEREFHYVSDDPFEHDVQMRVPDVRKSREILGFKATTSLSQMLDEVIPWIRGEVEAGRL